MQPCDLSSSGKRLLCDLNSSGKRLIVRDSSSSSKRMRVNDNIIERLSSTGFPLSEEWMKEFYEKYYNDYLSQSESESTAIFFKAQNYTLECNQEKIWIVFNQILFPETVIARGSSKTVLKTWDLTSGTMVTLHLQTDSGKEKVWKHEVKMLDKLKNLDCINAFSSVYQIAGLYRMVTPYFENDLVAYIAREPSREMRIRVFQAFLKGVKELHKAKVIHKDLKPENVVISLNGDLKIIDLGFSRFVDDRKLNKPQGTPAYLAPEVWENWKFSYKTDTYSAGIVGHCIMHGKWLSWMGHFERGDLDLGLEAMEAFSESIPDLESIDYVLWRMMQFKEEKRLSIGMALKALSKCKEFKSSLKKQPKSKGAKLQKVRSN